MLGQDAPSQGRPGSGEQPSQMRSIRRGGRRGSGRQKLRRIEDLASSHPSPRGPLAWLGAPGLRPASPRVKVLQPTAGNRPGRGAWSARRPSEAGPAGRFRLPLRASVLLFALDLRRPRTPHDLKEYLKHEPTRAQFPCPQDDPVLGWAWEVSCMGVPRRGQAGGLGWLPPGTHPSPALPSRGAGLPSGCTLRRVATRQRGGIAG